MISSSSHSVGQTLALPLAFLAVLGLLALSGCSGPAGGFDVNPDAAPSPAVEAVQSRQGAIPLSQRLSGVVRAENQVAIYSEISAPVVEVLVRSGQQVERGQPLVRLDGATYREQLAQADANVRLVQAASAEAMARVEELEAQVVRTRRLAAQELISSLELETQEAQLAGAKASAAQQAARVEQAMAAVDERRSALARTILRAPVAGTVGRRNVEVGMLVDPGTQLFLVGDLDSLTVEVPITERMLAYVEEGQPVEIRSPALGERSLSSVLSRISPFLQQSTFSTLGEIDLENTGGKLRPGMFVTVDVAYGQSDLVTLVPTSALWDDPATGLTGIYVLEPPSGIELTASPDVSTEAWPVGFRAIEILAEGRLTVGVGGLDAGAWVVTVGQNLLSERSSESARARAISWEDVLGLQSLQKEDLLRGFLEKQQRLARIYGAEPPANEEILGAGRATGGGSSTEVVDPTQSDAARTTPIRSSTPTTL